MQNEFEKLLRRLTENSSDKKLIEEAFDFAKEAYKDKFSIEGKSYIYHALRVANALNKMGLDSKTIAFGILHDVLDDIPDSVKKATAQEIEKKFGKDITDLIEKISETSRIRYSLVAQIRQKKSLSREKLENLRKMFLAISGDIRVVLVELLSRLDGMAFLNLFPQEQQKLYALETLKIFVPVANRLGLREIKRNLEDISFFYLLPEKFKWVKESTKIQYAKGEKYLKRFIPKLNKIFKKAPAKILDINYRTKSYWSIYKKLLKHNMDFDKIHDLLALRIITKDVENCYKILGIVHKHFKPISEEINDYIARPKSNGYRSLHTTIFSGKDKITEIQIRTEEMQKEAEYGICAHWAYKEKIDLKKDSEKFEWIKNIDFFAEQIFTQTPKGDVIILPKNSTPIDFAYAIHSEIGNHCQEAKVGGKIVPLSYALKNGDIVEIVIDAKRKPSQDWLRFVKTSLAENQIKKALNQKEPLFKFPIPEFIKRKFQEISEKAKTKKEQQRIIKKEGVKQIYLAGQKGMLIHIAKCCNPQPGDKVKAYLSQHRAAILHRVSCKNLQKLAEKYPEKIIDADWK
jgi:RelA/SpoT family (p)ppGpp synthetase